MSPERSRVGTEQHFRWLHGIVASVLLLNLCDVVFTIAWVSSGLAREANPLVADLVSDHPVGFAVVKLGLVGMGSWLLWERREHPYAVVGIFAAFVAYYAVLTHHLQYAVGLGIQVLGLAPG